MAEEIGSTAKTVKRRLENLEANRYLVFSLDWVPCSSGDPISIVHAKVRPAAVRGAHPALINRKDPHILGISAPNTEPGLMVFSLWARNLRELREVETSLNANDDFESLYSNLFYDMRLYPTWTDKLIADRSK